MTLHDLVRLLRARDLVVQAPDADVTPTGLAVDSRLVTPGALFIAVRGPLADGHAFLAKAVAAGAVAVVAEQDTTTGVPLVIVRDGQRAAQLLAEAWYGYPASFGNWHRYVCPTDIESLHSVLQASETLGYVKGQICVDKNDKLYFLP